MPQVGAELMSILWDHIKLLITDFDPRDMGQLSTYVAAVDGIMKSDEDQPTIGLLICKTKDNVLAQYAADVVNAPIGISHLEGCDV